MLAQHANRIHGQLAARPEAAGEVLGDWLATVILRPPHARYLRPSPDVRLCPELVTRALAPVIGTPRLRRIERVIRRRLASVTVLIDRPYDPHNAAAVFRTCEALGLLHVHVVPFEEVGGFSFSRRITQRADKWLNIYLHRSAGAAIGTLKQAGFTCWAARPPALGDPVADDRTDDHIGDLDASATEVDVSQAVALVIGNEHAGLSDEALAACDRCFALPMFGFSESLNLSVSAALGLADVVARRRRLLGREGDLGRSALAQLRAACCARSVKRPEAIVLRALRSRGQAR